jgi:hypothetical protein
LISPWALAHVEKWKAATAAEVAHEYKSHSWAAQAAASWDDDAKARKDLKIVK